MKTSTSTEKNRLITLKFAKRELDKLKWSIKQKQVNFFRFLCMVLLGEHSALFRFQLQ